MFILSEFIVWPSTSWGEKCKYKKCFRDIFALYFNIHSSKKKQKKTPHAIAKKFRAVLRGLMKCLCFQYELLIAILRFCAILCVMQLQQLASTSVKAAAMTKTQIKNNQPTTGLIFSNNCFFIQSTANKKRPKIKPFLLLISMQIIDTVLDYLILAILIIISVCAFFFSLQNFASCSDSSV